MKSIDEKIFQLLFEEELIDSDGKIIDENFIEEIKYLIEGKLRDAQQNIKGAMKPFIKHLLLLKYYKKLDRNLYKKAWKKDAKMFLLEIKLSNCRNRKCIEQLQKDEFKYDRKKVYIPKEKLNQWLNDMIMKKIAALNKNYKLKISLDIKLTDIDNFQFYENDEQIINSF